jgi:hypothetical protein
VFSRASGPAPAGSRESSALTLREWQIVELIASSYNPTGRSLTLASSLSSAQHWALRPLLDWSAAGPVPQSRTSPVVLDRPLVRDRSATTTSADRRNPGRPAIHSA